MIAKGLVYKLETRPIIEGHFTFYISVFDEQTDFVQSCFRQDNKKATGVNKDFNCTI